jgi:glycosyltransferase involved in cell wall biosynthesis
VADYTRRLAAHLRRSGIEPLMLTTYTCARNTGEGSVGVTDRWGTRGAAAAARHIRRLDLDVVHVQFAPSVFGSSRAVGLLPLLLPGRLPLVVTLHEYGVWSAQGRTGQMRSALWSAVEGRGYADRETLLLAARATCLLLPSPEHREVVRSRFRRSAPATLEVPIGLNVDVGTRDRAAARTSVRRELGAGPDAQLVVFFGFLHPAKALDHLIVAVAALRPQRPDVQLILVGGAESHSVPRAVAHRLRLELEEVAAAHGVRDRVHFTGYLPDAEVARLLQAADAAAFPFKAGVTRKSSSILAALAAGVPVVATAPSGEVRVPTEAGGVLRVPPNDIAALTAALAEVLSDRALAARLSAAGQKVAASQSWEAISAAHAEVYARARVARRGGRSRKRVAKSSSVEAATATEGDADVTS